MLDLLLIIVVKASVKSKAPKAVVPAFEKVMDEMGIPKRIDSDDEG